MSTLRRLMQAIGARCPGGHLPNDYLVVDVETSGWLNTINPNGTPACIVQFGVATVIKRQVEHLDAFYIKRPPGTMQAGATGANRITDDMLVAGTLPEELYPRLIKLLTSYRERRCPYVGHNLGTFDRPFINTDLARHGFDFAIQPDELLDTGMLYKASRLGVSPRDDESRSAFFKRISNIWSHEKWNLVLATRTLHLDTKFKLDLATAHNAGVDCCMTYLLLEELRRLAEGAPNGY